MTSTPAPHSAVVTVLVVEDDEDTRQFVEDFLLLEGYQVLGAATGEAARAQVASHPLDVILLDRRLPDADGVDLCRQFRTDLGAAVPIIVITADRAPGLEATARAAGATDFLLKPYHPDALLTRLPRPT